MAIVHHEVSSMEANSPTLAEKVAFLSQPTAYAQHVGDVDRRETHMSWVFLAGDKVFKLKKPVRFPYLDFSTLNRREVACRSELSLNRRLAPDVYLDVVALVVSPHGLSIGGSGVVVDWLVAMRRLDEYWTLERAILESRVKARQIDGLVETLQGFYRHANRVQVSPAAQLRDWQQSLAYNRRVLLDPRFALPFGVIRRINRALSDYLAGRGDALAERARRHRIIDGHGDLRPEHIWLNDTVRIIDCLEFNAQLRAVDYFDEIAYLSLECERLGAAWIGDYITRGVSRALHDAPPPDLFLFYRCHRAMLRARLAIAHLFEPDVRTPEKWPRRARAYLNIAARDAARLDGLLRTR